MLPISYQLKCNRTLFRSNMATALFIGAFLVLCSSSLVADDTTGNGVDALQEVTTPEGHTFWYYHMPTADRTALAITWDQEVPLLNNSHPSAAYIGVNVMLNGGAGGRTAADIVADYEDLDGGSALWVEPREVSGFVVAPDKHLAKAREIAEQVLSEPALEERWFDREKQNLIDAANDYKTNSWGMAWNLVRAALWGDHPYRKAWELAPIDEIQAVTLADVNQWHALSFSTNANTVAVAGSEAADTVAKEVDLLFADLPTNVPAEPIAFAKPAVPGKTVLLHIPEAPKSVVVLIGEMPANDQTSDTSLQLATGVLGHGKQSRLFKTVRSGLGASYGFGANLQNYTREHRLLEMTGEVETAKLQAALSEIEKAYSEFVESGVGRIEFPLAKRIYKREAKKGLKNPVNVAFSIISAVKNGFDSTHVHSAMDRIDALKRGSTNDVISASFPDYEDLLKIIVSPDDKAVADACVISTIEDVSKCL